MNSWPLAADVSSFLIGAGYTPPPTVDLEELIGRAVDEVHSTTGIAPFLAGDPVEVEHVARSGVVLLDRPFAVVSGVEVGGSPVDFLPCPQLVAPVRRLALESEFTGAVQIIGRVGFGVTIPVDIWYAVRDLAASFVVELVDVSTVAELESVKQDSVTLKYQTGGQRVRFAAILADRARIVFQRYRISGMGG